MKGQHYGQQQSRNQFQQSGSQRGSSNWGRENRGWQSQQGGWGSQQRDWGPGSQNQFESGRDYEDRGMQSQGGFGNERGYDAMNQSYGRGMREDYEGRGMQEGYGSGRRYDSSSNRGYDSNYYGAGSTRGSYDESMRDYNSMQGSGMRDSGYTQGGYGNMGGYSQSYGSERGQNWGESRGEGRFMGRGPKGYQRSDERIKEEVCDALTRDPSVDASEIEVDVKDRVVTLKGSVDERNMKRLAEDCAERVQGVGDVKNEIRVQSKTGMQSGRFSEASDRDESKESGGNMSSRSSQSRGRSAGESSSMGAAAH